MAPPPPKEIKRNKNSDATKAAVGSLNGLYNSPSVEEQPIFNEAPGEKVISNGNAYIVLGRDRPVSANSGNGATDTNSFAMDFVVGRQSANSSSPEMTENNFGKISHNKKPGDAARIYISQRAKIDEYFGLCKGQQGFSTDKSAIALYADDVRIMARRGIKIVTGGPKQTDANNFDTNGILGIELIAGNIDHKDRKGRDYLQPMVKGDNLVELLEGIIQELAATNALLKNYSLLQLQFLKTLLETPLIVATPTGPGTAVFNPKQITDIIVTAQSIVSDLVVPLSTQSNGVLEALVRDFIDAPAGDNILSKYNRVN
jgi:hypothetical protein